MKFLNIYRDIDSGGEGGLIEKEPEADIEEIDQFNNGYHIGIEEGLDKGFKKGIVVGSTLVFFIFLFISIIILICR